MDSPPPYSKWKIAMSQTLAKIAPTVGKPAPPSQTLSRIGLDVPPGLWQMVEARYSTLCRSLDHRDNSEAAKIVAVMLAGYPSARAAGAEAKIVIAAYVSACADLPPWAVAEAATAWARGTAGATASAFAPSAAQLHELAADMVWRFDQERRRLKGLLAAEQPREPDEAERERVGRGFERLKATLRGTRHG